MTRINIGVPVESVDPRHLVAEYREIGRVGVQFIKRMMKGLPFNDIPPSFTLGKGHQTFFLNKGKYIHKRFEALKTEMIKRGYQPSLSFRNYWENYPVPAEPLHCWRRTCLSPGPAGVRKSLKPLT